MPPKTTANSSSTSASTASSAIPPFKVGRNYMYDKHVDGYHAIMSRHDCSEIRKVFEQELSTKSSSPSLRVADLGCGTGRGTKLMLEALQSSSTRTTSSSTFQFYAVDKSAAMVKSYIKNIPPLLESHNNNKEEDSSKNDTTNKIQILPTITCADYCPVKKDEEKKTEEDDASASANQPPPLLALPSSQNFLSTSSFIFPAVGSLEEFSESSLISSSSASSSSSSSLLSSTCDFVVCAWTLSHVMSSQWGGDRWHSTVKNCVEAMERMIDQKNGGGGTIFIIETLGTDTEVPTRKSTLHAFLEDVCGFDKPLVVRTDYKFDSVAEGEKASLFFFGEEVKKKFLKRHATNKNEKQDNNDQQQNNDDGKEEKIFALPEVTGIWIRRIPKKTKNEEKEEDEKEKEAPSRRERE